jgi:hypothetical protein
MWASEALKEWREFYLLIGTAGATLLALLFVAVSLGAGYISDRQAVGTRTFMSPVVIHFTSVFFISAIALVPTHQATFFATLIGATAVIGASVSAVITALVVRTNLTTYVQDYFAYGLLPAVSYLALLIAALLIYLHNEFALDVLAGALLVLTIVNIRNVWDLTLSMVRHQARQRRR